MIGESLPDMRMRVKTLIFEMANNFQFLIAASRQSLLQIPRACIQELNVTSIKFIFRRAPVLLAKSIWSINVSGLPVHFHEKKNY